jgi:hypothetical protein
MRSGGSRLVIDSMTVMHRDTVSESIFQHGETKRRNNQGRSFGLDTGTWSEGAARAATSGPYRTCGYSQFKSNNSNKEKTT